MVALVGGGIQASGRKYPFSEVSNLASEEGYFTRRNRMLEPY